MINLDFYLHVIMARLEEQLDELEVLEAMFSSPGEFEIDDTFSYEKAKAFVNAVSPDYPGTLSCKLRISVSGASQDSDVEDEEQEGAAASEESAEVTHTVEISLRLPNSYPESPPEVYVSANDLNRSSQDLLNFSLQEHLTSSRTPGEPCLLLVVDWVREHAHSFFPPAVVKPGGELDREVPSGAESHFCRMWLYMHHIYSKTKRRNILALAADLQLTGFCLPGKPGVVCVEGTVLTTREFYNALRRWNWKSIACRKKEEESSTDIASHRKIEGFRELEFEVHGPRHGRMDMGQFLEYLRAHELSYMFKELFGVEGHSS